MANTENSPEEILAKDRISFIQGQDNLLSDTVSLFKGLETIKRTIVDLSNVKNIHFLLGAGASSDSIPAMKGILKRIEDKLKILTDADNATDETDNTLEVTANKSKEINELFENLKGNNSSNLEEMLGVLYSHRAWCKGTGLDDVNTQSLINLIEEEIFAAINIDLQCEDSKKSLDLFKNFYQKLALRNKDLSRVNIFTTNNDLLSECALDHLNINFNNGFGGGLNRIFNPARFSYTFSKKIDHSLEKYEPLENMIYLYKLHGSISWIETDDNSYFNIQEIPIKFSEEKPKRNVLVYPTPLKQNKSLGAPYSDLIREFQKKLLVSNSVLFIIGYSFSDEHINNVIYQALATNSSISIVIFGEFPAKPIFKVADRRIYKISGITEKAEKIHYFDYIVQHFIPDLDEHKESNVIKDFIQALAILKLEGDKTK